MKVWALDIDPPPWLGLTYHDTCNGVKHTDMPSPPVICLDVPVKPVPLVEAVSAQVAPALPTSRCADRYLVVEEARTRPWDVQPRSPPGLLLPVTVALHRALRGGLVATRRQLTSRA